MWMSAYICASRDICLIGVYSSVLSLFDTEIVCDEGMKVFAAYKEAIRRASVSSHEDSSQEKEKEKKTIHEETSSSFPPCIPSAACSSSSSLFVEEPGRKALTGSKEVDRFASQSEKKESRELSAPSEAEEEKESSRNPSLSKKIRGVVLLCVMSGSLSEGVSFNDSLARLIFLIGLPYPNIKDPEFQLRSSHFHRLVLEKQRKEKEEQQEGKEEVWKKEPTSSKRGVYTPGETDALVPSKTIAGSSSYGFLQCMQTINQTIGRSIRHKEDYACVFLIDRRYQEKSVQSCLSKWIQDSLHYYQTPSPETFKCMYTSGEGQKGGKGEKLSEGEKQIARNLEGFFHKMSLLHK